MKYLYFFTIPVFVTARSVVTPPPEWTLWDSAATFGFLVLITGMGWLAGRNPRPTGTVLEIHVSTPIKYKLVRLQADLGAQDLRDVAQKAFALLDMAQDHQRAGGTIQLINPDGTTETLPPLHQ